MPMLENMASFVSSEHMGAMTFDPPVGPSGDGRLLSPELPAAADQGRLHHRPAQHQRPGLRLLRRHRPARAQDRSALRQAAARAPPNAAAYFEVRKAGLAQKTTDEVAGDIRQARRAGGALQLDRRPSDRSASRRCRLLPGRGSPAQGRIRRTRLANMFSGGARHDETHAPLMGEHTRDMLAEAGYVQAEIEALLAAGAASERRRDDETLTPEPIDVAATLDAALDSPDPGAVIEALAPTTPTYRLLRQALQDFGTGIPVGGKTATARLREIEVNLERERWLPRRLPADRVWVNVADQRLVLYRDDRPVFSTRVIVGQDARGNQSPELQASIDRIWFNPPWTIPEDIVTERDPAEGQERPELPGAAQPGHAAQWRCCSSRQDPTQRWGHLLFEMNNRFDVYLHDTPSKNLFSRDDRRISHGCIRVENPQKLAALLMQQSIDAIDQTISTGNTTQSAPPKPVRMRPAGSVDTLSRNAEFVAVRPAGRPRSARAA